MGIWIRSSDKSILVEVSNLFITGVNDKEYKHGIVNKNNDWSMYLGAYSTLEKTLKVMDMIKEHIESSNEALYKTDENVYHKYNRDVFQMPKDSEVE